MVHLLQKLLALVYPPLFTEKELKNIPHAPNNPFPWIFARYDYHCPQGKRLIYYIKKHRDYFTSTYLAKILAEHLKEYLAEQGQFSYFNKPIIIPIPASPNRLKKIGFNQNHLIAKNFALNINGVYEKNILLKKYDTQKQALIRLKSSRIKNIKDSFSVNPLRTNILKGQDIIIIDDLTTTGATLCEAKSVLEKYGARNIIAITLAH
jgi:ComF family protein